MASSHFVEKLMESVYFKERLKEKWQLYRSTELSDGSIDWPQLILTLNILIQIL